MYEGRGLTEVAKEFLGEQFINDMRKHVPDHMHGGLLRYLVFGINPGSFLTAVITDRFSRAVSTADDVNRKMLLEWATFMTMNMPMLSWGDETIMSSWMQVGGLEGFNRKSLKEDPENINPYGPQNHEVSK